MNTVEEKKSLEETVVFDKAEAIITNAEKEETHTKLKKFLLFVLLPIGILLCLLLIFSTVFAICNISNETIISRVSIQGIDVSKLTKQEAIEKVSSKLNTILSTDIKLQHGEYETTILPSQFSANFDIIGAVDTAYSIGRNGNIFQNNYAILDTLSRPVDICPSLQYDEQLLNTIIDGLNGKIPDGVKQPSYYIEDSKVIITNGKDGVVVNAIQLKSDIITLLTTPGVESKLELPVEFQKANLIDMQEIHNQVYKEPVNAYYTTNPYIVHPHVNGVDFKITLEEATAMIATYQEEYVIPLKTLYPNVTTNQIGSEAFPDLLSQFSTNYSSSNRNRSNNLNLAAKKVNGTVIMPGETFSYNQVVGKRTIEAGFKSAAVYSNGQVVDGIGGGICQISSTLYNAVLLANLEVTERTNHGFTTGYVKAGTDATVSWGSLDFKFKNNRNYPIKIVCYASGGVASFKIFGLKQEDDCIVKIEARTVGSIAYKTIYQNDNTLPKGQTKVIQNGSNGCKTETYKSLYKQDGTFISRTCISRDTYNPHNKIIAKGTK